MKLKYWYYRFKELRKDLKTIFVIALAIVLLTDLWLINVPEKFPLGAEIGSLLYKLSLAYITGLIFYFINIHLQAHKNKVNTVNYLQYKTEKIERMIEILLLSMKQATKISNFPEFNKYDDEIEFICRNLNPHDSFFLDGDYGMSFPNWFDAMNFVSKEHKSTVNDLYFIRDSIDSDVLKILLSMDSWIETSVNLPHGQPVPNKDLTVFSLGLTEYRKMTKKLNLIVKQNYKNYHIEYKETFSFSDLTEKDS
ncbi:hypothetical protein R0K17_09510 [Planococcus sp. SIMBA_143]